MATYATYRHVELDHVGYGKRRVLKPPGGGSSDIFGATGEPGQSPRRVKTHNASTINLSDTTDSSSVSSTASSDSPTPTSPGPRKDVNEMSEEQSEQGEQGEQVTAAADSEAGSEACEATAPAPESEPEQAEQASAELSEQRTEPAPPVVRKNHMQSNIVLGDDRPGVHRKDSGSESLQNGGAPKTNGAPVAPRTRVPPGGYSSGLW